MLRDLPELAFPIAIDVYLAPIDQEADGLAHEGRVPRRGIRLRVSDHTQAVLRQRVELVKRHMPSGPGPIGPAPGAPGGPPAPGPGPGACGCCCCASCACCASRSACSCAAC